MFKYVFTILVACTSLASAACEKLEGTWEGFQYNSPFHSSHILELNADCTGFYVFSIGETTEAQGINLISFDETDGIEFRDSYIVLQGSYEQFSIQVLMVVALGPVLSVITSLLHDGQAVWATSWQLSRVRTVPRNTRLYESAKNAL